MTKAAIKAGEYEWWNPDPDVRRKETKKKNQGKDSLRIDKPDSSVVSK